MHSAAPTKANKTQGSWADELAKVQLYPDAHAPCLFNRASVLHWHSTPLVCGVRPNIHSGPHNHTTSQEGRHEREMSSWMWCAQEAGSPVLPICFAPKCVNLLHGFPLGCNTQGDSSILKGCGMPLSSEIVCLILYLGDNHRIEVFSHRTPTETKSAF